MPPQGFSAALAMLVRCEEMSGYPYTSTSTVPRRLTGPRAAERRRSGLAGPLSFAALCVVGLVLVWVIAELVPVAHAEDATLLGHFLRLNRYSTVNSIARVLPTLLNPVLFTLFGIALVLIAIAREHPRVAVVVAAIMALGPLSAEQLKPLMAHSHAAAGFVRIGPASYPSGHSTAAGVLAISMVLVASPRVRPLVAVFAAAFALAVGAALLIRAWHMPSDVLGGFLLALVWGSLAVAGLRASERRRPSRAGTDSP
jgi:membrane-associated phospholipid phosphatase